jgi:hypothetical protein
MSYLIEHQDESIWTPSKDVGDTLLVNVRYLESRLGLKSGLAESMSDTIEVEFDKLAAFLLALRRWASPDKRSMQILTRGAVIHLLALLSCRNASVEKVPASIRPNGWMRLAGSPGRI